MLDLKEYTDDRYLLFATKQGIVKKTKLSEYDSPRTGLAAINLKDGDELVDVRLTDGKDDVFLVSRRGQAIRFKESLARPMGRATAGVIGMRLGEGDHVLALALGSDGEEMVSVTQNGYGKRSRLVDYPVKGRGGKGVIGHQLTRKTGELAGAFVGSKDQDLLTISSAGKVQRVAAAEIRRVGAARRASGRCGSRTARRSPRSRRSSSRWTRSDRLPSWQELRALMLRPKPPISAPHTRSEGIRADRVRRCVDRSRPRMGAVRIEPGTRVPRGRRGPRATHG